MLKIVTKDNISNLEYDNFLKLEEIKTNLDNNPFGKYLVYKDKEEILGYIYYSDIYERVEINNFLVKKIHRNCGIGNILLKFLTETVDKTISLEVRIDNYNAIHLYEKYGFKKQAIRKNYYNGIDGILMVKEATN